MRVPHWLAGIMGPIKAGLAASVLMAGIALLLPNYYVSETRLLPVESKGGISGSLGSLASAAAAFGVNVPSNEGNDANFVDILGSRTIRETLLGKTYTFHYRKLPLAPERYISTSLEHFLDEKNRDRAVKRMATILTATRDNKTKILSIRAETRSSELSQLILKDALQLLENFAQEKGRTRGGAKAIFAEARLVDARKELDTAEAAFRNFIQVNRGYQTSSDPAIRLLGGRFESEYLLRRQLVATLALSREQALMEEKNDIPIVNVLDKPNLPIDKSSPARTKIILFVGVLVFAGTLIYNNREWINSKFLKGL